jgi:hypothetical protein
MTKKPQSCNRPWHFILFPFLVTGLALLFASCSDKPQTKSVEEAKPEETKVASEEKKAETPPERRLSSFGLPEWLVKNPIQLHWEGPLLYVEEDGSPDGRFRTWLQNVQNRMRAMEPAVTVGLSKKGSEGAWWPSRVGESLPQAQNRNIFKEFFLDPMDGSGIKFIAYYRHDIDKPMEMLHPEWRCLDTKGQPIANMDRDKTAHRLCYNSPYREFVKTRLVELAEQGTPGVYFDQDHMPEVCTCENCKTKFLAVRGYPMPENLKPYTAEYLDVGKFVGDTISETFSEWRAATRKVKPDMIYIAGADELLDFVGIHHAESLPDSINVLKSEFQKCFGGQQHFPGAPLRRMLKANPDYYSPKRSLQESLAWITARDLGEGRPAHIWNYKPDKDFGETFHTNAAIVAHGDISSATVDMVAKQHSYKELFQLGKALGNELADARPYGWAAIYISNAIKEQAYPATGAGASYKQTFEQLYAPVLATTDAFQRKHFPFVTIFDTDIRKGRISPLTKVLIAPSADLLPADLQASLSQIEAKGVKVIRLSSKDPWYLANSVPTLQEKLLKDIEMQVGQPPIQLEASPEVRANYFVNQGGNGILVAAVRDWNDFWFFGTDQGNRRASLPEPAPIPGMTLIVRDPSIEVKSAKLIDFASSPSVEVPADGKSLKLPEFPIYQFLQITKK